MEARDRRDRAQDRIDKTLARGDRLLGKYAEERRVARELQMLRWTKAAAILAAIAAVAAILALLRP